MPRPTLHTPNDPLGSGERRTPDRWAELPPVDDGTMSILPDETALPMELTDSLDRLWQRVMIVGGVLGLALAMVLLPRPLSVQAPSALSVVTSQGVALSSDDPEACIRALELGSRYLEHGPEGPYRDLIAEGQQELSADCR